MTQVTFLLVCELVTTTRNKLYKDGDRSELVNIVNLRAREEPLTTHLYGGFHFFVSDYLVRIGEACLEKVLFLINLSQQTSADCNCACRHIDKFNIYQATLGSQARNSKVCQYTCQSCLIIKPD